MRIRPNGSKIWLFKYPRPFTKARTNLGFGTYPEVSLADARKKRLDAQSLLADNIDPKAHRDQLADQQREALNNTFAAVTASWLEVKKTEVSPDHGIDIQRSLELHAIPALGNYPVSQLKAKQVIEALKPLEAKGSLESVKRICQRLNEIMVFAVNTGLIEANPLAGIKKAFESPTHTNMPTIAPDMLPELMQALSKASIKIATRYLIEWQLHTITRPGEACKVRWSEIDFDNQLWNVPAETMKRKREHTVPLTPQTLTILEAMKPISGHREFVFVGDRNPKQHMNPSTANVALKRMGYHKVLVAHGLRSLASTILNEQGFDPDVIEAALSHVDANTVRRAYNRTDYLERRKPLMCWWSEHIEKAATGNLSLSNAKQNLRLVNS